MLRFESMVWISICRAQAASINAGNVGMNEYALAFKGFCILILFWRHSRAHNAMAAATLSTAKRGSPGRLGVDARVSV